MKVLGFVGSPRKKGNIDIIVDTFLDGAKSSGAQIKKYFLQDYKINQCMGCFRNCMLQPGYKCEIFRDDMDTIMSEMASSDLMVFASPLYCATFSAIMARFFERMLPFWEVKIVGEPGIPESYKFLGNPVKGKKAVIGIAHDFKDPSVADLAIKAFEHNVRDIYMMEIVDKIHVPDVRDPGDVKGKPQEMERIFALGKKLAGRG